MRVPERQKKRREYLKKKAGAYVLIMLAVFVCLALIVGGMPACGKLADLSMDSSRGWFWGFSMTLAGIVVTIVIFLALYFGGQILTSSGEITKTIPYVPPITPNTLPAEEVLVRGSQ